MINPALARLAGRPLALAPRALDGLLATGQPVQTRPAALPREAEVMAPRGYAVTADGIAVVPVVGPLVSRSDWLSALFGAASYGEVGDAIESAFADPSSRAVLLEVDSPGGEVGGLFDLVDRITALREEIGKPLWAVASEAALSAAYAISSAANCIYVTRTGEVGSVGVVALHVDESAADAMAGLKWTLIHAGARKVDGNPHEPLSGSAFTAIQADVDGLHAQLAALVADNRGIAPEAVHATEAAVYRGSLGINAGLADRLGSLERALADLAAELDTPRLTITHGDRTPTPRTERTMTMTAETPAGDQPALAPQAPAVPTPPSPAPTPAPAPAEPAPAAAEAPAADRLRAEYAEIAAVAAQAARLGVAVDAADAMRKGIAPDAIRRSVLDALASRAEATDVVAAAPAAPAVNESPIVRRARERAAHALCRPQPDA